MLVDIVHLGLYRVVLTTPKTSSEKNNLTLVEVQKQSGTEKVDSMNDTSFVNWTIYNGWRKLCPSFKTDMDKLNIAVYRNRNNTYIKDTEMELKLTQTEKL